MSIVLAFPLVFWKTLMSKSWQYELPKWEMLFLQPLVPNINVLYLFRPYFVTRSWSTPTAFWSSSAKTLTAGKMSCFFGKKQKVKYPLYIKKRCWELKYDSHSRKIQLHGFKLLYVISWFSLNCHKGEPASFQ